MSRDFGKWYPDGLFYEKIDIARFKNGSIINFRGKRLFCVTYWFLKWLFPEEYKDGR